MYRSFSPVLVIALGLGIVPACPRMPVINALRSMSAKGCVKSAKFHCIATLRLKSRFVQTVALINAIRLRGDCWAIT